MKKRKIKKNLKRRDGNIIMSIRKECDMRTKCNTPNKRAYTRKQKHKLFFV